MIEFHLDKGVAELGDQVVVGLPYTATAETLRIEDNVGGGTLQGRLRHFNRIFARLVNNSGIPSLNGRRGRIRNAPAAPEYIRFSGDVEVRDLGQRKQGVISVVQELPLATEIVALFGKARVEVT